MGSAVITEMAKFRGLRERVALFLPLQLYLAKELQRDSGLLVVDGVSAPQSKQEVRLVLSFTSLTFKISLSLTVESLFDIPSNSDYLQGYYQAREELLLTLNYLIVTSQQKLFSDLMNNPLQCSANLQVY